MVTIYNWHSVLNIFWKFCNPEFLILKHNFNNILTRGNTAIIIIA